MDLIVEEPDKIKIKHKSTWFQISGIISRQKRRKKFSDKKTKHPLINSMNKRD